MGFYHVLCQLGHSVFAWLSAKPYVCCSWHVLAKLVIPHLVQAHQHSYEVISLFRVFLVHCSMEELSLNVGCTFVSQAWTG